ncbi:MAG: flagellar hook-basal body complex protein FliE [Actinomycetota bacterium]
MAFPIPPISTPTPITRPSVAGPADGEATEGAGLGGGFTNAIGDALSDLGRAEAAVEEAALRAATGDLTSVSDYMIAATEAQIATEITVAVRDRAITAFNDIMRMQI